MTVYGVLLVFFAISFISPSISVNGGILRKFQAQEITVQDIQIAFKQKKLTSRKLVEFYISEIQRLNPVLRSVLEINPDALYEADKADQGRKSKAPVSLSNIHGIPILLKDNIATKDKLNHYCRVIRSSWVSCATRCRCGGEVKKSRRNYSWKG